MKLYGYKLGLETCLRLKKNRKDRIYKNAKRGAAKPWKVEFIKSKQPMSSDEFFENIGNIFPTILEEVSKGQGLPAISLAMGFNDRFIERAMERYPKLNEMVREARRIRMDDAHFQ